MNKGGIGEFSLLIVAMVIGFAAAGMAVGGGLLFAAINMNHPLILLVGVVLCIGSLIGGGGAVNYIRTRN